MEYILTIWVTPTDYLDFRFETEHDLAMFIRDVIVHILRKKTEFRVEKVKTNDDRQDC